MKKIEPLFYPDDFDRIYLKYFKKLKDENKLKYDPSGWLNTISFSADTYLFPDVNKHTSIVPYYTDYYDQLYPFKEPIGRLLSEWDNHHFEMNEFTLCSSVTIGSLAILSMFSKSNIQNIFFETPAFYASINQARSLGLSYQLVPTYQSEQFKFILDFQKLSLKSPIVIWLTQPRMSLGLNQDVKHIQELYSKLPEDSYIVIDEASEQFFPSHLNAITTEKYPRIIKIRNIYKGLGINGVRMSYISHNASLREFIQREIENFQGALDYYSLIHTENWSNNISQFKTMLEVANSQTKNLRIDLSRTFDDEFITFSRLVNGYVGSMSVDFSNFKSPHRINREKLLKYCFENGISIIVGATMKFACHEQKEFVRINFFKPRTEIESATELISNYLKSK